MEKFIPVENKENLVRDSETKAILNTDKDALRAYKIQKRKFSDVEHLKEDVAGLQSDVKEIKELLLKMIGS